MTLRKQIAILIAVLCISGFLGTFLFSLGNLVTYLTDPANHFHPSDISAVVYVSFVASLVSVPVALLTGCPTFFLLRKIGLLKWWVFCIIGMFVGALLGTTSLVWGVSWISSVGLGALSALISWLLIVRSDLPLNGEAPPIGGTPVS